MITLAEKFAIIFGVSTTTLLCGYAVLKPKIQKIVQDNDIVNRRNEIIKQKTVKVLYSTMSFFYLQQYSKTVESFLLFKEILDVAKPKIVALQISEKEYLSQYQPVIRNPSFQDAMRKVEYLSKTNAEELLTMKELDFYAGLENLYAIDFCMKNNCKVVYADEPKSYFQEIYDAKLKLRQEIIETPEYAMRDIQKSPQQIYDEVFINKRSEIYVEKLMSELTPTFSLLPDVPYKVIVGLIKPELSSTLAQIWKQQFLSVYGHQIIEDETIQQNLQV